MYLILHFLFGWDYICWRNSAASGIARIHKDYEGNLYYWRYKITNVLDMIYTKDQVLWLTCPANKYFPNETTSV